MELGEDQTLHVNSESPEKGVQENRRRLAGVASIIAQRTIIHVFCRESPAWRLLIINGA